nr:LytTR family DNA-binding domain-containing protein [Oscillospiraceae bacterium]
TERHIDIFISYFSDGVSLVESGKKFDIIFMDFQMDKLNGIETARKINALKDDGIIIFVSAYTNVALDAYEVKAYRFLAKPINKDKLFKAIDDYRIEMDSDDFLIFKTHEGIIRIKVSQIIYAEACGSHSKIHTVKSDYEILTNLKEIQNKLPKEKFHRCHKAFLASFMHILFHNKTTIKYDDGSTIYISRNYLPKFRKAFEEYILKYNTAGGKL